MTSTAVKVLLDSTYLLPTFGIEVEGLTSRHIAELREAHVKGKVRFYCLSTVWVEVIGKVCRERERLRIDIKDVLRRAVDSLLKSEFYEWITPDAEAVKLAFELRTLGHRDNIDNLLYATSIEKSMIFLSMDKEFKRFLSKNGYKTENFLGHEELLKKVKTL